MKPNKLKSAAAVTLLALGLKSVPAISQEVPPAASGDASAAPSETPLGVRQQRIKRMVVDLERQFTELARSLQEEYPEQAEKLVEAFKLSKEMLLERRIDEISEMLNLSKLDSADEEMEATIDDVKKLIELLLTDDDEDQIQKEIEKLERWKEALDKLIEDETKLKEESELRAEKERALQNLDEQIEELERIIGEQEKLEKKTAEETEKGIDGLRRVLQSDWHDPEGWDVPAGSRVASSGRS